VLHPADLDGHRIQVPLVSGAGQPSPDPVGERLAKRERLLPNGPMADHEAARRQHLLDHAQAERQAEIQPDRIPVHLSRKAVAGIGGLSAREHISGFYR
jgi:hypothetical protein